MLLKLFRTTHRKFSSESALITCSPTKVHKCMHPKQKLMMKKPEMIKYLEQMIRIRKMEQKIDTAYKSGLVRGFCHLYIGQEAVAVGIEAALLPSDHLITAYRCHAQQLLRGDKLSYIFSELIGRKKGSSKGKGGSMHLYLPEKNFYGGNGIVGAQIPVGAGLAFASHYKNTKEVAVTMCGDGAANQGQVFEAANMAALWKLPLIVVIENNKYGMGTSVSRSSYSTDYYTRGDYVPGIRCDGLDVVSVKATMEAAVEHCRSGNGPIFVEMMTYRYHGHSVSDPGVSYRTKEEVQQYRKTNDAIKNCIKDIIENHWSSEEELKAVEKSVAAEVNNAYEEALQDSEVSLDERFKDIYYNETPSFIRGTDRTLSFARE